jgi:DNA-binding transcriptional MerR regulator
MKKLSEVCKIVGVTRRTLQEYDRIGLVVPTSKTSSGYWLYDDNSIRKLMLIRIFVEGGYERKTIKAFLESPTCDILQEFDQLIEILESKIKKIDGMIKTVKNLKLMVKLPESTLRVMGNLDVSRIYKEKSFSSCLEDSIINAANYSEPNDAYAEEYFPFIYQIIAVGSYFGTPVETDKVQKTVKDLYEYMLDIILYDVEDSDDESLTEEKAREAFADGIEEMIEDQDFREIIELQFGIGVAEYINKAVRFFSKAI